MMIRLTTEKTGVGITLRADCVLFSRRDPDTQTTTHVVTNIMGPQGLQAFHVRETPEEVAMRVNAVLGAHTSREPPAANALGFESLLQ